MSLWTAREIAAATGGTASGDFAVTGISFDSREVGAGDLFVALKGESTDGHRFVAQAAAQGAAGMLVSEPVAAPHVRVADTTVALEALARAARGRMAGKVLGVTGSVGKTGTKEMLFAALDRAAPGAVHRSLKSYNNHIGVPLSLARMPADTRFGVFEMGMNHAGEIAGLTRLVRPHVAIITTIAPAHIEHLGSEDAIADAKGEIFDGLEPGGTAIIPYDSPQRERLVTHALRHTDRVVTFGVDAGADVQATEAMRNERGGTFVSARLMRHELSFTIGVPGAHWVTNALAVLAAVEAVAGDIGQAGLALAELAGFQGRGQRIAVPAAGGRALVIDESYNANPASMRATLNMLGAEPAVRRLAVLGEMRELGTHGEAFHAALADPLMEARVDHAILVGEGMRALAKALEGRVDFVHVPDAAEARDRLIAMLADGDAVLVKGSNGVGLSAVVESVRGQLA